MTTYRVGVIGCGRKGTGHARAYALHPQTEVVAAADSDPDNLALFCERFNLEKGYSDYRQMLASESIDIAAPILPVNAHPEGVIACAEAGVRAIFCEKPMACSLEEADRMVEACKDIPFAAGDAYRSFPQFWDAKALIDEGEIGPIRTINLYQATNEISGGGCQGLCVMGLFAGDGDIDWITGWVVEDPATDADQGMGGYVRYANGIEAFSHCRSAAKKGIEIICTHGVFYSDYYTFRLWKSADGSEPTRLDQLVEDVDRFPESRIGDRSFDEEGWRVPGFRNQSGVQSIVDALDNGTEPACPGHIMRNALETAIAFRESHRREHAPIRVPLTDRSLKIVPKDARMYNKKEVQGAEWYADQIGTWTRD
jgi:predicted dehydrogenase